MSQPNIVPPIEPIRVASLNNTFVTLFRNGTKDCPGMIVDVDLNPNGNYLTVVVIDIGCDDVRMLGFIEHDLSWVPVRKDTSGYFNHEHDAARFDIRHASEDY